MPPLGALVVFEAAGRHLNFSGAAAELKMTQPAVSHQIRCLEARIGLSLFRRMHRGVALTTAGALLLDAVNQGLTTIHDAAVALRRWEAPKVLRVLTDFGFAAWWLMPRLASWSERAPDVDVRIITSQQSVDLRQEDVDVAILFGHGTWPSSHTVLWFMETVYPVCSADFAEQQSLKELAALQNVRLLHVGSSDSTRWLCWSDWFSAHRLAAGKRKQDLTFNNYQLVLQAALLGQGVALGWRPLIDDLVQTGRIVCLTDTPMRTERGYYIVEPTVRTGNQVVSDFRRWLLQERDATLAKWPV